ncbi:ferredoxin [Yinghuangia sp. ASG 101]|nr:ferredoxin [Yinghuangia sp. ASG 101]
MCAFAGPDAYPLDDSGHNELPPDSPVDPGLADQARQGALQCPERAITITDA